MHRIILLLFAVMLGACSARTVHEPAEQIVSPTAININLATAEDLEKLPGIGRKTAESIVSHRNVYGPFRRAEHVMLIRGISEKRFLEMQPFIVAR